MGIDKRTLPALGTLIPGRPANPSAKGPQEQPVFKVVAHRYDEEDGVYLLELAETPTKITVGPVVEQFTLPLPFTPAAVAGAPSNDDSSTSEEASEGEGG